MELGRRYGYNAHIFSLSGRQEIVPNTKQVFPYVNLTRFE